MAEEDDNATIKLKIGGTSIEIPERKARRELERLRTRLRRELFKAQEFLEDVGLSSDLLSGSSPAATPSGSGSTPLPTPGSDSLPSYSAAVEATNTLTEGPSASGTYVAETTSLRAPPAPAQSSGMGSDRSPSPLPAPATVDPPGSEDNASTPSTIQNLLPSHSLHPQAASDSTRTDIATDHRERLNLLATALFSRNTDSTGGMSSTSSISTSTHPAILSPLPLPSLPIPELPFLSPVNTQAPIVSARPPPYSPRAYRAASVMDHDRSGPLPANGLRTTLPTSARSEDDNTSSVVVSRRSTTPSTSHAAFRHSARKVRTTSVPMPRSGVPVTRQSPEFPDIDANVISPEVEQVMEPVPSHPFFHRTPRRMPTLTTAANMLYSEANSANPQTPSPLSPTGLIISPVRSSVIYDRVSPTKELAATEGVSRVSPNTASTSTASRPSEAFSLDGNIIQGLKAGAEGLIRAATSPVTRDMLMALTVNEASAVMDALPNYDRIVQACLQSESMFDYWVRYCQTSENGKQYADAILCTMQRMLDRPRPRFADDALQLLRRTMLKLSLKCQVMPSLLFQRGVECFEPLPRYGGSFGDVFHGTLSGREVALKRLRLFQIVDKDRYWKSLCREALLWRQLHHPFVLPFLGLDGSPSDGAVYMISPWMENGSLPRYFQDHNVVDSRLKRIWISQTASGLNYLHENGVLHGDLRGANILLDQNNYVHLADFGLAKLTDAGKSTMGISTWHTGATRWMSPEVLQGGQHTFAGDVYSFACVCLEIVTELSPFPELGKDAQVIAWVSAGNSPLWPETGDADLDEVGQIITPAWNRELSERPTMKDLRDLLAL